LQSRLEKQAFQADFVKVDVNKNEVKEKTKLYVAIPPRKAGISRRRRRYLHMYQSCNPA